MRKRLYSIIEVYSAENKAGQWYDTLMLVVIITSLVPLAFKTTNTVFEIIDIVSTAIFIIDYLLRWVTADYKLEIKSPAAFVLYPFTPMAFIDLVVILTALPIVGNGFKVLKAFRLMRTLRVVRTMKIARYSKSLIIIIGVLKKERKSLGAVATLAVAYILIAALVIFNIEPDSFNNFFDAVYWATVSLTTVGYGDIYPTSSIGRIVTMLSSLFGIAIVALPSGIITGGYLSRINENNSKEEKINNKENEK
ncbi:MAG: ion transporter [Ruminococcus sp.]|nr:ion transporter [Ruminococcus sp.]